MERSLRIKGILMVSFGALLWGTSGTAAQYLFQSEGFTTEWLVAVRMFVSGIFLIIMNLLRKNDNVLKIWTSKSDAVKLIIFSLIGMLGVQYTYFAAVNHGNAATATILQYLSPAIITIYLVLHNKKMPSLRQILCIFMAITGTFLIITKGNINSLSISKEAVFWGIASAVTAAIYTVQPVSLLKKYGAFVIVGWGMFIGGTVFSIVYPPFNCEGNINFKSVMAIIFVVIFGTLIAFSSYLGSLKYIEPYEASILGCIEPLSAAILSIMFLNVTFGLVQWIGTICIIAAISILSIFRC